MANPRGALGSGAGGLAGERQKPAFALCMPLKNGRLISKFRVASPAGMASGESLMLCLWVAAAQCCRPFQPGLPIANWLPYLTIGSLMIANTISPYVFFWQASQVVEELEADPRAQPLKDAPNQARTSFFRIRIDTYFGMGFSNLVAFFIMLTTATTLSLHGVTNIET